MRAPIIQVFPLKWTGVKSFTLFVHMNVQTVETAQIAPYRDRRKTVSVSSVTVRQVLVLVVQDSRPFGPGFSVRVEGKGK